MTNTSDPRNLTLIAWLNGPQAETRALLTQLAQTSTLQITALPLLAALPYVVQDVWQSSPDTPSEELRGLRFQAGPVCAYVVRQAGLSTQVEFQIFAQEPCTLKQVLHELPALVAILLDTGFQIAVGWSVAQSAGETC